MQLQRILVVSHSAEYRDLIKARFRKKNIYCHTAATPQKAEGFINSASWPFDVLVIDHPSFIDTGLVYGLPALLQARYRNVVIERINARVDTEKTVVVVRVNDSNDGEVVRLYPKAEIIETKDVESIIDVWKDCVAFREAVKRFYQLVSDAGREFFQKKYGGKWVVYEGHEALDKLQTFDSRVELFLAFGARIFSRKKPVIVFVTREGLPG